VNAVKPRYQQLKDLIIHRISTGELQPSDRVPSEYELVEAMSVSRMTANRALRELNDEGYVKRIAGRGTFVSDFRSQSSFVHGHTPVTPTRARRSREGAARGAGHRRLSPATRAS
jgi:GntR family histidine utilization transcriptional repressor